jgi:hypothetical protein
MDQKSKIIKFSTLLQKLKKNWAGIFPLFEVKNATQYLKNFKLSQKINSEKVLIFGPWTDQKPKLTAQEKEKVDKLSFSIDHYRIRSSEVSMIPIKTI